MSTSGSLPGFRQLALMWLAHLAAIAWLAHKGYLQGPHYGALLIIAMVSFVTGARVERYRAELAEKVEDPDGSG